MMSESIELHTFHHVNKYESHDCDIEEYEEVSVSNNLERKCPSINLEDKVSQNYDFFTNHNLTNDNIQKLPKNKINKRKKTNLIDLISLELALIEDPIEENVFINADWFKDSYNFIRDSSEKARYLYWHKDAEVGNKKNNNIKPKYPQILENVSNEPTNSIQYLPAITFNEFINYYDEVKEEPVKILDIEINSIKLENYYKSSLEELLKAKFYEIHHVYINIQRSLSNMHKEIKVNRDIKDNFKIELLKISSKKEDIKFDPTLRKYINKLILLKEKYIETIKLEKITRNKLECLWSDIEMLKYKQKCKQNGLRINIDKTILTDEEFEDKFNEVFNTEYSDILDKIEYEYVTEYIEYKKRKYEEKVDKIKVSKPRLKINEIEIRDIVEKLTEYQVKKEKISISIIEENKVKNNNKKTLINNFCIKIYVDKIFVCQSEPCKLDINNEVNITDCVSVQIIPRNSILTMKLYENNIDQASYNINIGDIHIRSEANEINFNFNFKAEPTDICIGCGNSIKEIAHANGVRLKSSNIFTEKLYTKCKVNVKIGWIVESIETGLQDAAKYVKVSKTLNSMLDKNKDRNKLKEIIEKVYDKDVIKSNHLINKLNELDLFTTQNKNTDFFIDENSFDTVRFKLIYFRNLGEFSDVDNHLIPIISNQISTEQLNFLQDVKDIQENNRYLNRGLDKDMINIEIQRYIGVRYTQNINKNILKKLNDYIMRNTYKDVVHDFRDLSIRSVLTREMKLENISIFGIEKIMGKEHQWTNGNNKEVDIFVTILRAFNLPDRSSPIITEEAEDEMDDDNIAGFKMRPLRPFVRVNYQDSSYVQSVTAIGCHPTWNQTLRVRAKVGSATMLQINIYDEVKTNISGNYAEDTALQSKTVHYRYYNKWLGSVNIPLYAVFNLGKLQGTFKVNLPPFLFGYENSLRANDTNINLNSIIKNGISVISLQITSNLPYLIGFSHSQPISAEDYIVKHINNFVNTFKNDFPMRRISLTLIGSNGYHKSVTQFLQPIPPPSHECFPKKNKRIESAISKSSGASKSSSTKSMESKKNDEERTVTPRSMEKESVNGGYESRSKVDEMTRLICGYLRYVSLIPAYEVNESCNVTLNGMELLKILNGSPLDHTLLLASYYLHLGIKCWIVVGVGLPKGISYYVLIKYDVKNKRLILIDDHVYEKSKIRLFAKSDDDSCICYLFDATNGEKYELRDISCPLKTVHYVFDDKNIWVNIQASQECESVSFDFTRSSNWQQVFNKSIFAVNPTSTIESNLYSQPIDVDNLRQKLEDKIKFKIQKWRPHMKTIWNRYCSSLLHEVLPQWEYWSFCPTEPKPGLGQKLKQLAVTYKMYGSPQNFPFTRIKRILNSIKSTGLHVNDDPDIEFALAVQIFSYPNSVISVWIFLVSITRVT